MNLCFDLNYAVKTVKCLITALILYISYLLDQIFNIYCLYVVSTLICRLNVKLLLYTHILKTLMLGVINRDYLQKNVIS